MNTRSLDTNSRPFRFSASLVCMAALTGAALSGCLATDDAEDLTALTQSALEQGAEVEVLGGEATWDRFGVSVAVDGDCAVVGAAHHDPGRFVGDSRTISAAGSVYFYDRTEAGWGQPQRVANPKPAAGDQFGYSVDVSGDWAIVGAYRADRVRRDAGAAYLYHFDGAQWMLEQELNLAKMGPAGNDRFGIDVAIEGDVAVVGAISNKYAGVYSGAAFIYRLGDGGEWSFEKEIGPTTGADGDWFGRSVAISGNTVVVGAAKRDGIAVNTGAAYIFEADAGLANWQEVAYIPDAGGFDVAVDGERALIGHDWADGVANDAGAAHLYTREADGSWSEEALLTASDGAAGDRLGRSVALDGDLVVLGSYRAHVGTANDAGRVYLFAQQDDGSWSEQDPQLSAPSVRAEDLFGRTVALSGQDLLVTALFGDGDAYKSGAVVAHEVVRAEEIPEPPIEPANIVAWRFGSNATAAALCPEGSSPFIPSLGALKSMITKLTCTHKVDEDCSAAQLTAGCYLSPEILATSKVDLCEKFLLSSSLQGTYSNVDYYWVVAVEYAMVTAAVGGYFACVAE